MDRLLEATTVSECVGQGDTQTKVFVKESQKRTGFGRNAVICELTDQLSSMV